MVTINNPLIVRICGNSQKIKNILYLVQQYKIAIAYKIPKKGEDFIQHRNSTFFIENMVEHIRYFFIHWVKIYFHEPKVEGSSTCATQTVHISCKIS